MRYLIRSLLVVIMLSSSTQKSEGAVVTHNPKPDQELCLATAVYHEARGEIFEGKLAVAYVVLNRVKARQWSDTACEVVYQPNQFTDIDKASPDYGTKAWLEAQTVVKVVLAGLLPDPTGGATYYYAPKLVSKPKWAQRLKWLKTIGGHRFYS